MEGFFADKRVLLTGGAGFLGSFVGRELARQGCRSVMVPRRAEYDLTDVSAVRRLYEVSRPDLVLHLAGEVGGIGANRENPGRFFYANLAMGLHLIEEARRFGVGRFLQVGTICSYPKFTPVPFREEHLWDGYPEETNAPYGIAKKALLVMLEGYHRQYGMASGYLLPVNLYGPGDNFDPATSHVIPALVRKCCEAADTGAPFIECWGTGSASREFLYVEDAARAVVLAARKCETPDPINLGSGSEITIRELVGKVAEACGFRGEIRWDPSRPDGQPRRCLDTTKARELLGFTATMPFEEGLRRTVEWWRSQAQG